MQQPHRTLFWQKLPGRILILAQGVLVILWLFPQDFSPGPWGQLLGRWHPLLVHFPIAFLLLLFIAWFFRRFLDDTMFNIRNFRPLMLYAALLATATALTGYCLMGSDGYDDILLSRHRTLGTLTALLSSLLWLFSPSLSQSPPETPRQTDAEVKMTPTMRAKASEASSLPLAASAPGYSLLMALSLMSLVLAGHYGGSLTHGEGYLLPAKADSISPRVVTDSTPLFEAAVAPILERNCYGCHNPRKAKGGLVMTRLETLLKGGKNGVLWLPGNPTASLLVQRLLLEEDNRKHMPPRGKPQLSNEEIDLIKYWIERGADVHQRLGALNPSDSLRRMTEALIPVRNPPGGAAKTYSFPAPDAALLTRLQSPYRSLQPLHQGSPAYSLSFYFPQNFSLSMLRDCLPISANVISLHLSRIPVSDSLVDLIRQFPNLERLNLSGSVVQTGQLEKLRTLQKLESISLSDTRLSFQQVRWLSSMSALKKVYLGGSLVDSSEIMALQKLAPGIRWDAGHTDNPGEMLRLTPPQLAAVDKRIFSAGEGLVLTHPMKGVTIRYRTDGKDPDSLQSPIYEKPLFFEGPTTVTAKAIMTGWLSSPVKKFQVYPAGLQPVEKQLLTQPDPKYKAVGADGMFDRQTGDVGNLMVHWLGYREGPMILRVKTDGTKMIDQVVISTALNTGSYVFPPQRIEVRVGMDSGQWKHRVSAMPMQPDRHQSMENRPYILSLPPGNWQFLEIRIQPIPKLPAWHGGRGEKGWTFVDEVFID